jgi:hypothetical protein
MKINIKQENYNDYNDDNGNDNENNDYSNNHNNDDVSNNDDKNKRNNDDNYDSNTAPGFEYNPGPESVDNIISTDAELKDNGTIEIKNKAVYFQDFMKIDIDTNNADVDTRNVEVDTNKVEVDTKKIDIDAKIADNNRNTGILDDEYFDMFSNTYKERDSSNDYEVLYMYV